MSWDGLQREALGALGYRLYRPADEVPARAAQPSASAVTAPAVTGTPQPAGAVVPAAASVRALHPLQLALLRAIGRDPADPRAASLCDGWPPPDALRDPAAKRALWPRLRALRAGRG